MGSERAIEEGSGAPNSLFARASVGTEDTKEEIRHAQILYFTYIYEFYLILFSRSYSIQRIEKKMCSKKRNTRTNFLKQTLKNSSSGFHFFFKTLVFYQKTGF